VIGKRESDTAAQPPRSWLSLRRYSDWIAGFASEFPPDPLEEVLVI
jgi:hypothetical protein